MKVIFENGGVSREVKVGFSWTVLLFGPIPLLFRGEFWQALVFFIASSMTFGVAWVVWAFLANKYTARRLATSGWKPVGTDMGTSDPVGLNRILIGKWGISN